MFVTNLLLRCETERYDVNIFKKNTSLSILKYLQFLNGDDADDTNIIHIYIYIFIYQLLFTSVLFTEYCKLNLLVIGFFFKYIVLRVFEIRSIILILFRITPTHYLHKRNHEKRSI